MSFGDKCPICKKEFKSDACPHYYGEAEEAFKAKKTADLVAKEVRRQLIKHGLLKDLT